MQNIHKDLKPIDMKKIEKYVVFKYEDEFGFHYMVINKLPRGEPTSSEKKINPVGFHYMMMNELPRGGNLHIRGPSRSRRRSTPIVLRELSLVSRFRRTANWLMCSAPNSSLWRVGGQIRATFGNGRKGHVSIRLSRS